MAEEKVIKVTTLIFRGKEYIAIDNLIEWLKINQHLCNEKISVHWLIKTFVAMKNSK
jgi:hypothetical protein